jgi:hypothetical protein
MGADYYRLIREALEGRDRLVQPTQISNRTLLYFPDARDLLVLNEEYTSIASAVAVPAEWGPTTTGPDGGNFRWNQAVWA